MNLMIMASILASVTAPPMPAHTACAVIDNINNRAVYQSVGGTVRKYTYEDNGEDNMHYYDERGNKVKVPAVVKDAESLLRVGMPGVKTRMACRIS